MNARSRQTSASGRQAVRRARGRRFALALNMLAGWVLALALVVLVNLLAQKANGRWDWSRTRFYELSDKTLQLLEGIDAPVQVTLFFQTGHDAYRDVTLLLEEYRRACPYLHVMEIDPDRDLAVARQLAAQYGVRNADGEVVDERKT